MRKTIIFGALAALLGFAAAAQASDDTRSMVSGSDQVTQERTTDGRDTDHDRNERRDHARDMRENHNDGRESHHQGREQNHQSRD